MPKLIMEVRNVPRENDILVFDGKAWKPISKKLFLAEHEKEMEAIRNEIAKLKQDVNEKLKDFHDILQLVSEKED